MSLKIVVCIKQVPDSWSEKHLTTDDATLDRVNIDRVLNDLDEYAVEEAVTIAEKVGGNVTALCMGPDTAHDAITKALQMGADHGILVTDSHLRGSDAMVTSGVLAAALSRLEPDLIVFGIESTDAKMAVIPSMVAERLSMVQLTAAQKVSVETSENRLMVERRTSVGQELVAANMPVVLSVVESMNQPRYPSMKSIMAARKKHIETWDLTHLGLDPMTVGLSGSWSRVDSYAAQPPKSKGDIITDDGEGGLRVAEFLEAQKLI